MTTAEPKIVSYKKIKTLLDAEGFTSSLEYTGGGNYVLNSRKVEGDTALSFGPFYDNNGDEATENPDFEGYTNDFSFGENEMEYWDEDRDYELNYLQPELTDSEEDIARKAIAEYTRLNAPTDR